jgi:hypothetical protein
MKEPTFTFCQASWYKANIALSILVLSTSQTDGQFYQVENPIRERYLCYSIHSIGFLAGYERM